MRTYLDYNASAPLIDEARAAMIDALEHQANASSVHFEGRHSRAIIERARGQLGALVGAGSSQIVFTSGASEAATHALSPIVKAAGHEISVSRLYVSAVEHPCVLAGGRFTADQVDLLPVDANGLLNIDALKKALENHDATQGAAMVAVQLANNETGVLQPIEKIAKIVHAANAFLVVDAVQALGKIKVSIAELGAHFVIVSSHKIGGPQGAGALIFGDASISPAPMIRGGGQENYQRGGTENTAAIAGFGVACEVVPKKLDKMGDILHLRDYIEAQLEVICSRLSNVGNLAVFGREVARLPNTCAFALAGIKAETALIALDLAGISVSSGSACSSGKVKRSHVLEAMGINDELMGGAIRLSLGSATTQQDITRFLETWENIVSRTKKAA